MIVMSDSEFSVTVRPEDMRSDPDVLISVLSEYPNDYNSNAYCHRYGFEICFIPQYLFYTILYYTIVSY